MKTISKRISALLIVIVMLFVMTSSAFAETEDIDVQYDYPLTPDDGEQWRSLLTLDAMVNACDVPSERLNRMTTRALVETVLDYPLLLNMVAYNTIQYPQMLFWWQHISSLGYSFHYSNVGTLFQQK